MVFVEQSVSETNRSAKFSICSISFSSIHYLFVVEKRGQWSAFQFQTHFQMKRKRTSFTTTNILIGPFLIKKTICFLLKMKTIIFLNMITMAARTSFIKIQFWVSLKFHETCWVSFNGVIKLNAFHFLSSPFDTIYSKDN